MVILLLGEVKWVVGGGLRGGGVVGVMGFRIIWWLSKRCLGKGNKGN